MKGAFNASRQTGSVSRHRLSFYVDNSSIYSQVEIELAGRMHPASRRQFWCTPKKQTSPKGRARVKGGEVETVSHITCFINFKPRFDIIVRVWIAQIVAKYESRPSRRLYGNHTLQIRKGRGFEADFLFIPSIALSSDTVTRSFVSFRFKFYLH